MRPSGANATEYTGAGVAGEGAPGGRLDELVRRFEPIAWRPYPEPPHTAVVLPINLSGVPHTFGLLVAGVSARRARDEPYRTFYLMVRESVTNALTNARLRAGAAPGELDRAKTEFFSDVSHEFRTPLTLIMGPVAELRAAKDVDPARLHTELEVIHRNGLRLGKLVNTLLAFSRIQAGRMQARYEPVDLGTVTAKLASVFRSVMGKDRPQPVVQRTEIHLGRAHHRHGAPIRRLGLALAAELVALHRSTITADSPPGVGTTFTVTLPLGSAHLPADHIGPASTLIKVGRGAEPLT